MCTRAMVQHQGWVRTWPHLQVTWLHPPFFSTGLLHLGQGLVLARIQLRAADMPCKSMQVHMGGSIASLAGCVLGVVVGLGTPIWYINRTERDEERDWMS